MLLIPRSRVWTQQPQQAVAIAPFWLAQGLVDVIDMTGKPRSMILGTPASNFGTTPKFGTPCERGRALDTSAAFGGVYFQRSDGAYSGAEQTHVAVARYNSATGTYAGLFVVADGSGANNGFSLQAASSGADLLTYAGGTGNTLTGAGTAIIGTGFSVVGLSGGSNYAELFRNGKSVAAITGVTLPAYSTSRLILFGERAASASYSTKGMSALHLVFKTRLSPALHRVLAANPWQVFARPAQNIWVPVGAGGGSLAAAASGSATAGGSATLAAQVALAAVGVSTAGGSASAGASVPLSAAGISVAGGTGNAIATVTITAAGLAQAAGSAGLSASVLIAAAGAAQAAGNATLAAQLDALATGAAQAGGSANLSGGAPGELSASGGDVASGSAVLSVTVQLAAAGSDSASGSANLSGGAPGAISAAGGAQAGGSATVSSTVALSAAGFVQAMGAGQIVVLVNISALGAAAASGHAVLVDAGSAVYVSAPSGRSNYQSIRPGSTSRRRPANTGGRRF